MQARPGEDHAGHAAEADADRAVADFLRRRARRAGAGGDAAAGSGGLRRHCRRADRACAGGGPGGPVSVSAAGQQPVCHGVVDLVGGGHLCFHGGGQRHRERLCPGGHDGGPVCAGRAAAGGFSGLLHLAARAAGVHVGAGLHHHRAADSASAGASGAGRTRVRGAGAAGHAPHCGPRPQRGTGRRDAGLLARPAWAAAALELASAFAVGAAAGRGRRGGAAARCAGGGPGGHDRSGRRASGLARPGLGRLGAHGAAGTRAADDSVCRILGGRALAGPAEWGRGAFAPGDAGARGVEHGKQPGAGAAHRGGVFRLGGQLRGGRAQQARWRVCRSGHRRHAAVAAPVAGASAHFGAGGSGHRHPATQAGAPAGAHAAAHGRECLAGAGGGGGGAVLRGAVRHAAGGGPVGAAGPAPFCTAAVQRTRAVAWFARLCGSGEPSGSAPGAACADSAA